MVSTAILRVVTDRPLDSLASHEAEVAPRPRAISRVCSAMSRNCSCGIERRTFLGRLRFLLVQDTAQAAEVPSLRRRVAIIATAMRRNFRDPDEAASSPVA